ncbi:MAG: ABC transporter ATP-binding protein [Candidatus Altiarchaeota archaeon]|nr:ABC transporter ATP-binding protein [Candidatus Altiarchaeota archaeon]
MKAIQVQHLSKKFNIPYEKTSTVYDSIMESLKGRKKYDTLWALKNINFTVEKGESLGVIGGNGSGKSTLLKLIANILRPTQGTVQVHGKLTSFLELGVGFQQELTARENIYLYSKIMGLRRREIDEKLEEIIKFSELERFIDTKLKNFSSGMQVRLAFATAIQTDPQILLVDEVLAVGDMSFQQKCFDYFNQYVKEGRTMVFVTHDLSSVARFCRKTLLLKDGEMADYGETSKVIDTYIYNTKKMQEAKEKKDTRWGNQKAAITDVEFLDKFGNIRENFNHGDPLTIRIHYDVKEKLQKPTFGIAIHTDTGLHCYGTNTELKSYKVPAIEGEGYIDAIVEKLLLAGGKYYVTVAIHSLDHTHYDWINQKYYFNINPTLEGLGMFNLPVQWRLP